MSGDSADADHDLPGHLATHQLPARLVVSHVQAIQLHEGQAMLSPWPRRLY